MSNIIYGMVINNCANVLKRRAELNKIVEENGGYTPNEILKEWKDLEGITAFDLALGISVGFAMSGCDVVADIVKAGAK